MEVTLSIEFSDLHSLYRSAEPEEQPTRADKRAVRAAILGAGIASSALHATTASAKLISLVPGGAKVLTIGQLVVYTGLGAAVGTSLAFVGAATAPREPVVAVAPIAHTPVKHAQAKPTTPEAAPASSQDESEPPPAEQAEAMPVAPTKPASAVQGANRPPTLSRVVPPVYPSVQPAAPVAASALALTPSSAPAPPSLIDESRELATVRTALGSKDATRALQLLDAQDQAFRAGSLTQERSAARVIALCIAGRTAEARLAQDRFITAYPGSPWLRRINATCTK